MPMKKAHGPLAKDEVGETGTVRERTECGHTHNTNKRKSPFLMTFQRGLKSSIRGSRECRNIKGSICRPSWSGETKGVDKRKVNNTERHIYYHIIAMTMVFFLNVFPFQFHC